MISDSEIMNYYVRAVSTGKYDQNVLNVLKSEMTNRGIKIKNLKFSGEFEIQRGDLLSTKRVEMYFDPK